jgi:hypothetical protein
LCKNCFELTSASQIQPYCSATLGLADFALGAEHAGAALALWRSEGARMARGVRAAQRFAPGYGGFAWRLDVRAAAMAPADARAFGALGGRAAFAEAQELGEPHWKKWVASFYFDL